MSGTGGFAYDLLDYPSGTFPLAHPGHIHAVGRMFGADPAPVEKCRVLEFGCGDGTHLIGCAYAHPGSVFVGLDLSIVAIERGKRAIAALGLANVTLHHADLTAWEPPAEPFDYVIAHGLYSWVPAPVREHLLSLCSRVLAPNGLCYISYNTYPGCHVRKMVWEILKSAAAGEASPQAKVEKALAMARFLKEGSAAVRASASVLVPELDDFLLDHKSTASLFHDDLSDVNDPMHVTEFLAHAARHGLRFAAEAEAWTMETSVYPEAVVKVLEELAENDVVAKEQHIDFLRLRRFRQTILTRGGSASARPDANRLQSLFVSSRMEPEKPDRDLAAGVAVRFKAKDAGVSIDWPIAKAALLLLGECWPDRMPFEELLMAAASKFGREATPDEGEELARLLTQLWMRGLIQVHAHRPAFARTASEKPRASRFVLHQVREGIFLTSLLHTPIEVAEPASAKLVQLLDGTRDREELTWEMAKIFPPEKRPPLEVLRVGVDRNLELLALAGILEQ
jgi:SAM-dependent methyltransferase